MRETEPAIPCQPDPSAAPVEPSADRIASATTEDRSWCTEPRTPVRRRICQDTRRVCSARPADRRRRRRSIVSAEHRQLPLPASSEYLPRLYFASAPLLQRRSRVVRRRHFFPSRRSLQALPAPPLASFGRYPPAP